MYATSTFSALLWSVTKEKSCGFQELNASHSKEPTATWSKFYHVERVFEILVMVNYIYLVIFNCCYALYILYIYIYSATVVTILEMLYLARKCE